MGRPKTDPAGQEPRADGTVMVDNLKRALTELLVLTLFTERDRYIGELAPALERRSGGALNIVFPYAAIYRMTQAGHLRETEKRTAPDGRLRQYYGVTEAGRAHQAALLSLWRGFTRGAERILDGEEDPR